MKRFMSIMSLLMLVCLMAGCGSYDVKNAVVDDAALVVYSDVEKSLDTKDIQSIVDKLYGNIDPKQIDMLNKPLAAFSLKCDDLKKSLSKVVFSLSTHGLTLEELDVNTVTFVMGVQFKDKLKYDKLEDAVRAFLTEAQAKEGEDYRLTVEKLDDAEFCLLSDPNNADMKFAVAAIDKQVFLIGNVDGVKEAVKRVVDGKAPKTEKWMLDVDKQTYVAVRIPAKLKDQVAQAVQGMPQLAGLENAKGAVLGLNLASDCVIAMELNLANDKDAQAVKKNVWDGMANPVLIHIQSMPQEKLGFDPKLFDNIKCEVKDATINVSFSIKSSELKNGVDKLCEEAKRLRAENAAKMAKLQAEMDAMDAE